jgi:hypothetical protein
MSLLLVLLLDEPDMLGLVAFAAVEAIELWLAVALWRGFCGCCAYLDTSRGVLVVVGRCSGGIVIGDLERLWAAFSRFRLCDRPRMREVMAPKKDSSAGEVGERAPRAKVDVGESISGDAAPDDTDFCEPLVAVRIGGGG